MSPLPKQGFGVEDLDSRFRGNDTHYYLDVNRASKSNDANLLHLSGDIQSHRTLP